jgi:hypothetical protein
MRRALVWVVAFVLGSLASSALTGFARSSVDSPSTLVFLLSLAVFAFVTVSVVTALEVVFPSLKSSRVVRQPHCR